LLLADVVVAYLHSHGVVHRDLKLENVIVDSRVAFPVKVKLIDFGLARTFREDQLLSTRCGSEEYAAPEIIKGDLYDGRKSDVWSLGIILYACLFGALPFNPDPLRPAALYEKICLTLYKIPANMASADAVFLIQQILVANPLERLSTKEILDFSWIQSTVQ
jgi:serine/threonine protein kinase